MVARVSTAVTVRVQCPQGRAFGPQAFSGCAGSPIQVAGAAGVFWGAVIGDGGRYADVMIELPESMAAALSSGSQAELELVAAATLNLSAAGAPKTAVCAACQHPVTRDEQGPWRHTGTMQPRHPAWPAGIIRPAVPVAVLSPPWQRAVAEAAEDDAPGSLGDAAREELANLWTDLDQAVHYANDGRWSMGCDNVTRRIIALSRVAGSVPWQEVPWPLLASGTYQGILADAGIEHTEPAESDIAAWRARQERQRESEPGNRGRSGTGP